MLAEGYTGCFVGGPGSRRPFAPFLGVLLVAVLLIVGVPVAIGVVWLSVYYGGGVARTALAVGWLARFSLEPRCGGRGGGRRGIGRSRPGQWMLARWWCLVASG